MGKIAIRVENLSKQYKIGVTLRDDRVKDLLTHGLSRIVSRKSRAEIGNSRSDTIWALKDVSFEVRHGETLGIIGSNGAGKSTLLKILSRITEPTSGRAEIFGKVGSLLEVGTGFDRELTGRENVYLNGAILGMKKREIDRKFDEIVDFSGIEKFIDTPVKRYSSGMMVRLAFAVAAHLEPEILIVDEVLAVGDAEFQRKCQGKMGDVSKEGRTVLFVSHNMGTVRNLCSRVLLLEDGRILSGGSAQDVITEYLDMVHVDQINYPLAQRQDRSGSGSVRAVSFQAKARDPKGGPPRTGAAAEFLVGYAAGSERSISRLYVAIGVRDNLGLGVFLSSTAMTNSDFHSIPPRGLAVCLIDLLPLIPGKYWVDIKLLDDEGQLDYVRSAASFDVLDGGDSGFTAYASQNCGSVIVPHKWVLGRLGENH